MHFDHGFRRGSRGMWTEVWQESAVVRRLHHLRRPICTHAASFDTWTGETGPFNLVVPFFCFSPYMLHTSPIHISVSSHPARSLSRIAMTPEVRLFQSTCIGLRPSPHSAQAISPSHQLPVPICSHVSYVLLFNSMHPSHAASLKEVFVS